MFSLPRCENRFPARAFPHPGDDGELRAHDETMGLWVPQLARDWRGREAKHVVQYKPADGTTGFKYHVWRYHMQENSKVLLLSCAIVE
jgi:hypothetical protein